MKVDKVTIVGSGNVAEAFARALKAASIEVVQLFARNRERGEFVASLAGCEFCSEPDKLKAADLYLLCVSDRAIAEVAASLPFSSGAIVAHTAGCGTLEMLPQGVNRAIIYPFQTFSVGRKVDFGKGYIFVEGATDHALQVVERAAHCLTTKVLPANSARRAVIHLSGVFACNFANAMYANAAEILAKENLPFDIVAPVIEETAKKAIEVGNPALSQTGPARRGDTQTLLRHRSMLAEEPHTQDIYDKISEDICERTKTLKSY
jgi:predicted short-subunit dehydrogenase-like oxidoreductase (DUF2520 family)